jgi:hypothetical protein
MPITYYPEGEWDGPPPKEEVKVIWLRQNTKWEEDHEVSIRVKIGDKYYAGRLEMSE